MNPKGWQVEGGFWRGFVIASLLNCTLQDWMGVDRYTQFAKNHWITLHWSVWLLPILLIFCLQKYYEVRGHKIKGNNE